MTPTVVYLDPRDILPDPNNSRTQAGDLSGLTATIREHGLLQPVGVVLRGRGYQVVYGNRRREAAISAGLERIPCIIMDEMDDGDLLMRQLLENLQRLDLSDLDKARAFRRALDTQQMGANGEKKLESLAGRLGLSPRQIQRYLGLLDLHSGVQTLLEMGELGVTQAQHLRQVEPPERQVEAAELAVQENLSAAELSRLCRSLSSNPNISPTAALAMMREGEQVPDQTRQAPRSEPAHLPPAPPAKSVDEEEVEYEEDYEAEDEGPEGWDSPGIGAAIDTATRDGNRVRKFHSLDSFIDEVDRLVRCIQEGDLEKLVASDAAAGIKLKLAARQARYLADRLTGLA